MLEEGLARLAGLLGGDPAAPGAGAAGGTGYGFAAAWGAVIVPGAAELGRIAGLPAAVAAAELAVTGEGRFDATSLTGKVTGSVLAAAAAAGTPVRAGRRGHRGAAAARLPGRDRAGRAGRRQPAARPGPLAGEAGPASWPCAARRARRGADRRASAALPDGSGDGRGRGALAWRRAGDLGVQRQRPS